MRSRADGALAAAGAHARVRIQPDRGADSDDDDLPADERLDRMLGDQDLLLTLQLSGYAPKEWGQAAAEFARYGLDVITGWLYKNVIFTKVYEKTQRQLRPPDERFDDDAVATLATDTVVAALDAFLENVLKQNKWDPYKGASLKTFFVGQCCFQFSNVYKRWYRIERRIRLLRQANDSAQIERLNTNLPAADTGVVQRSAALEALYLLSTDTAREAVRLASIGYSYAEVAAELGLTDEKAVENLIGYQRRRLAKMTSEERAG